MTLHQTKRRFLSIRGIELCLVDFGGDGRDSPPALLLHGLGGRGAEWHDTARWLRATHHVLALDQRGHGRSAKGLADYSRGAFVDDVIAAIEQLGIAPVVLIGQSMGGLNAFLVAARRPDLVSTLVVAEASPDQSESPPDGIRRWVESWPLPFATLADARAFFGGNTLYANSWIEILEERADGYRPQWEVDEMVAAIADVSDRDYWDEWRQVRCRTLVVGAERGFFEREVFERMIALNLNARLVVLPDARHDLHLDQPVAWRAAVEQFLASIAHR